MRWNSCGLPPWSVALPGGFPGVVPAGEKHAAGPVGCGGLLHVFQAKAGLAVRAQRHSRLLSTGPGTAQAVHVSPPPAARPVQSSPAIRTGPPVGHLGFVCLEPARQSARRQAGRLADRAVDVDGPAAATADEMVMVVADPGLETRRVP